jgi:myo-inositol-1(or 4)-monophosphatase
MAVQPAVINVMQAAARKAARRLLRDFGELENLQVSRKGPADFVTNADIRTDRILREELKAARPDVGFLSEEISEEEAENGDRRWIIDPIDGTTNFMHGLPFFAISIAYEEAGKLVAGIVYAPISDEMFWAYNGEQQETASTKRSSEPACRISGGVPMCTLRPNCRR